VAVSTRGFAGNSASVRGSSPDETAVAAVACGVVAEGGAAYCAPKSWPCVRLVQNSGPLALGGWQNIDGKTSMAKHQWLDPVPWGRMAKHVRLDPVPRGRMAKRRWQNIND
jgi:hypothetical protein